MYNKVIEVSGLIKDYHIYKTPRDRLVQLLTGKNRSIKVRALDNVTFSVASGEVVGILGRNGAGKSTLLKVLTHVLPATAGSVKVQGKVSAILELGVGINPEYSGKENATLGALARGVDPRHVHNVVDRIVDFSELGDVIDHPLKSYSSGMQARLLFSTAIMAEAETMIIDEALAAGDALFQEKCLNKMRSIAGKGVTILFVSHSIEMVQQLCTRAILLTNGRISCDGTTSQVTQQYYNQLAEERNHGVGKLKSKMLEIRPNKNTSSKMLPGGTTPARLSFKSADIHKMLDSQEASLPANGAPPFIQQAIILDERGGMVQTDVENGSELCVAMRVCSPKECRLIVGFEIRLPTGLTVYSVQNVLIGRDVVFRGTCDLAWVFRCALQKGQHILGIGVGDVIRNHSPLRTAPFEITDLRQQWKVINIVGGPEFGGVVNLDPTLMT
jgi:ABC-type polysaccharide/polyol phosphate transport system ATPase subunit